MSWEKMGTSKDQGGLGIRDLIMFNKALLAKQMWRMMQNPESLVGLIMKAKYFPNNSILEAKLGTRPSLVWKSLLASKELLLNGVIWRIGNGKDVRVWGEKWVPIPSSFSIKTPKPAHLENMTVSNLINMNTHQCDKSLISSIFLPKDAAAILSIPLSPFLPQDQLLWRCTKNGMFTVRSAYHLGMEMKTVQQPECSEKENMDEVWRTCRRLNIPNAVKMFLWRASHNLLPTKVNLFRQGICDSNLCPICKREEETAAHVCWNCPAANDVWGGCKIKLQKCSTGIDDFRQLFREVIQRCEKEDVELFAVVARRLWLRRNDFIHGGNFTHPAHVLIDSEKALTKFQTVNEKSQEGERVMQEVGPTRWQPPVGAMVKLNWDAAVDVQNKTIGLGIIIRNDKGMFLAALSKRVQIEVRPVVAETLTALHAVLFCVEMGYSEAWFEGDALQVVNEVNSAKPCDSMHGHLVEAIKKGLQGLNRLLFTHVQRELNVAAHELAVAARTHVMDTIR
jgi:hypothetical protein